MMDIVKDQWLPGGEGRKERDIGREQKIFQGSENTTHDTVMMDTCHYTFVQTHRMYNTQNEP